MTTTPPAPKQAEAFTFGMEKVPEPKTCSMCKAAKTTEDFFRSCSRCKECFRNYARVCANERKNVTAEQVREAFDYDPKEGVLRWKIKRSGAVVGEVAGHINVHGYHRVGWRGTCFQLHRLIWIHFYGSAAPEEIDHINGIPSDNRIGNLRAATRSTNALNLKTFSNNKSGAKGVCRSKWGNKWLARINKGGKAYDLGSFDDFDSAVAARKAAEIELYGEFANDR